MTFRKGPKNDWIFVRWGKAFQAEGAKSEKV